mgnify:CR=1 FL=1
MRLQDMWIKNTAGKPDAVLTMTIMTLVVVLIKYFFADTGIEVAAGHSIKFGTADSGAIAALLTPTLGAYVMRRYTEVRHGGQAAPTPTPEPEAK